MPECVRPSDALKGDYYMLNCSDYPSVSVECGFLSNPEEAELLTEKEYQEKVTDAVVSGVLEYLNASGGT